MALGEGKSRSCAVGHKTNWKRLSRTSAIPSSGYFHTTTGIRMPRSRPSSNMTGALVPSTCQDAARTLPLLVIVF